MSRFEQAVERFNRHEGRDDGQRVAGSLNGGLSVIRNALYVRVHDDVETALGRDSMLAPVSDEKTEKRAKAEIDAYQIAEAADAAAAYGYLTAGQSWFLRWLAELRLRGADEAWIGRRLARYESKASDDRRLAFTDVLARALSESTRAPLVLFRLLPLSVRIATALAFADHGKASALRNQQVDCLPAIADCHQCLGKVLENGEQCGGCGNPLWRYRWLTAAD